MIEFVQKITDIPLFWLVATVVIYRISQSIGAFRYIKKVPPIIIASGLLIFILDKLSISYEDYNSDACYITYLLGPATVALAYPFFKNFKMVAKNKKAILVGTLSATVIGLISVYLVAQWLNANNDITLSLLSKSITTPIAIEVSKNIGGIPALTACIVAITGLIGGLSGHRVLRALKIKHNISIGLAIGATSHVLGTSRCIEKKQEQQAAVGGLTIALVGLLTAVLAPILVKFIL